MPRVVIGFVVLAILGVVAAAGFQAGISTAGNDKIVDNETFTPDPGNVTELDESNRDNAQYDAEVDVYNSSGVEVNETDDYEWLPRNGTIRTVQGGALDGESSANITYGFTAIGETEREQARLLSHVPMAIGLALPIFALILFARFMNS